MHSSGCRHLASSFFAGGVFQYFHGAFEHDTAKKAGITEIEAGLGVGKTVFIDGTDDGELQPIDQIADGLFRIPEHKASFMVFGHSRVDCSLQKGQNIP